MGNSLEEESRKVKRLETGMLRLGVEGGRGGGNKWS